MTNTKKGLGRKLWCILLALALVVTMMPMAGGTAYAETVTSPQTPTFAGASIYANGTHIYIEAGTSGSTSVYYLTDSTKEKEYILKDQDLSQYTVYGGFKEGSYNGDTYVTMYGGTLENILGSGYAAPNSTNEGTVHNVNIEVNGGTITKGIYAAGISVVTGNVDIKVTGGTIPSVYGCSSVDNAVKGAARVDGNVSIIITGGNVTYVNGGDDSKRIVNGEVSGIVAVPVTFQNADPMGANDTTKKFNKLLYLNGSEFKYKNGNKINIPAGTTLTVANGQSLTISSSQLTNNGTIINNGTLKVTDKYTNNGTITNNGTLNLYAPITGSGFNGSGTVNCYATYIEGISSVSSISVKMDGNDYSISREDYRLQDGRLYIWLPSGDAQVTVNGKQYCGNAEAGKKVELKEFVAVSGLGDVPSSIIVNAKVKLPTVSNPGASYKEISWSITEGQKETGATITDGMLTATAEGTLKLKATVENGRGFDIPYVEEFTVEVGKINSEDGLDISADSIKIKSITVNNAEKLRVEYSGFGEDGQKDYEPTDFIVITGSTSEKRIIVESGEPNIVLKDCHITISNENQSPFEIQNGAKVNLTLVGTNKLLIGEMSVSHEGTCNAGLHVADEAELVISGDGELSAQGGPNSAGIGGGDQGTGGTITINSGTIIATGKEGAGIGGGLKSSGGNIVINGGAITATSDNGGAGIGGGYKGSGGKIEINGGTINATSAASGAGIGGGYDGSGGMIMISGGTVVSTSSQGAGIGGGKSGSAGSITISGGTITVSSTDLYWSGAGIGSGCKGSGGTVVIKGGNIKVAAVSEGTKAIGAGTEGSTEGSNVSVTDGNNNSISLQTLTLNGVSNSVAITGIGGSSYGIDDVTTLDTNKLYFYLPSDANIKSITAGGNTYICKDSSNTYYTAHNYDKTADEPTGQCTRCGEECKHTAQSGKTCSICGKTLHTHSWTYSASDNVITETCQNSCDHKETAALRLKDDVTLSYNGSEIKPLEVVYSDGWQGGKALSITYSNNTNVGQASGSISIGGVSATRIFEIKKATMSDISAVDVSVPYDGNPHSISVKNVPNGASVTYSTDEKTYTSTNPSYTEVGTNTVHFKVEKENYITVNGSASVTVSQAENTWTTEPSIENRTYGDAAKTPNKGTVKFGSDVKVEYKPATSDDNEYSTIVPTNVGSYKVRFSVEGNANYTALSKEIDFQIANATLTAVSVKQSGTLEYTGEAQSANVVTAATAVNEQTVTFTYSDKEDGTYAESVPAFKTAGSHKVYYKAAAANHNEASGSFDIKIEKQPVTEPTIASKTYTGENQKADVPESTLYSVARNQGGTKVGEYDVELSLTDSQNYKWSTTDTANVTLKLEITKAANAWTTEPAIESWTYGQTASTPTGAAKFGDVKISYSGKTSDGKEYNSSETPTERGTYTAIFTVEGTDDYDGLSGEVSFSINRKSSGGAVAVPIVPSTDEVTSDKTAGTTTSDTEIKLEEKTSEDGSKETTANVTVSDKNQDKIIDEAKKNDSKEIILDVSKDAVNESAGTNGSSGNAGNAGSGGNTDSGSNGNAGNSGNTASDTASDVTEVNVKLDKDFIESIIKDTDADLTIKTPFGDKTYTQEELKELINAAEGGTISLTVTKAEVEAAMQAEKLAKVKNLIGKITLTARSEKTAKKGIKVTLKMSKATSSAIGELKELGYTVKYKYYRSTKKTSKYVGKISKTTKTFTNTKGTKGTKYYYKARVQVFDKDGKLIAKTALKQCKYACRTWSK